MLHIILDHCELENWPPLLEKDNALCTAGSSICREGDIWEHCHVAGEASFIVFHLYMYICIVKGLLLSTGVRVVWVICIIDMIFQCVFINSRMSCHILVPNTILLKNASIKSVYTSVKHLQLSFSFASSLKVVFYQWKQDTIQMNSQPVIIEISLDLLITISTFLWQTRLLGVSINKNGLLQVD